MCSFDYKVNEFLLQAIIYRKEIVIVLHEFFAQVMCFLFRDLMNGLCSESISKLHDKSNNLYRNVRLNKSIYF